LIEYLDEKPLPARRSTGRRSGFEGAAATSLCLRWGTCLAMLIGGRRPLGQVAAEMGRRGPTDGEMARINIEASAAFAEWMTIFDEASESSRYFELVDKAIAYLPLAKSLSHVAPSEEFKIFANNIGHAEWRRTVLNSAHPEQLRLARRAAGRNPFRVIANYLVSFAWRNGPIEGFHTSQARPTAHDYHLVVREAASRFTLAMDVVLDLCHIDETEDSWTDRAAAFWFAPLPVREWTLDETSRSVDYLLRAQVGTRPAASAPVPKRGSTTTS